MASGEGMYEREDVREVGFADGILAPRLRNRMPDISPLRSKAPDMAFLLAKKTRLYLKDSPGEPCDSRELG